MLTSVTCPVELTSFRLALMFIGSVPWYWAVCLLFSSLHALPVGSNFQRMKDPGEGEGGGRKYKSCAFNLWEGPERRASGERVEAYCQIKSDRHSPDCKAIGSLTFDR